MGGGGGGSQGSGTSRNESTLTPNAAAMPWLGYMGAQGNALMDQPMGYFPGQTYVGPSNPTQAGVNSVMGGADTMNTAGNMMQGAAMSGVGALPGMDWVNNSAMGAYGSMLNAPDVANNPYAQGMMKANAANAQNMLGQGLAQQQQQSIGVNNLGSSRQGLMQGTLASNTARDLANTNAQMMGQMYGQGLQAQGTALGQTGNMLGNLQAPTNWLGNLSQMMGQAGQMQGQAGQMQLGAGQAVEDYQGRALQDALSRFNFQQNEPWQRMERLGSLANYFQPYGVQTGSGQGTQQGGGNAAAQRNDNLRTAASIIGTGAAIMAMSDRRLKRNIRQVGKTPAGFNIYAYDYVWGEPGIGVMADEVPAEWRVMTPSGFEAVRYDLVR